MKRFLLALVFFGAAIILLRRFAGLFSPAPASQGRKRARGSRSGQEAVTELVRDKVCNTFLPKSKALELTAQGETLYFCSRECRSKFLAGPASQADIARRA